MDNESDSRSSLNNYVRKSVKLYIFHPRDSSERQTFGARVLGGGQLGHVLVTCHVTCWSAN